MVGIYLQPRKETLWLVAAAVVSTLEIFAATGRDRGRIIGTVDAGGSRTSAVAPRVRPVGITSASEGSAILVLGNPSIESEGHVDLVLHATRLPQDGQTNRDQFAGRTSDCLSASRSQTSKLTAGTLSQTTASGGIANSLILQRVYFLPTQINATSDDARHTAIPGGLACETARVRIFTDQRLTPSQQLCELVDAVAKAAESDLGVVVEELAGHVTDVDHDGHLAIVITPEVARIGSGRTPVDGLTRPTDFLPGLDRPHGNGSDVIFLSSALRPGNQLRAVLAHEWTHAASFSRRSPLAPTGTWSPEDDWFHEATAHLVEVRASRSDSNVAHRIRHFLANPSQSPLIVRNYCQPEFWRHDGCRGAGYLFLESCLANSDAQTLSRLLGHRGPALASLQDTLEQSFEELFFQWSTQLGQYLASNGVSPIPGVRYEGSDSPPVLAHRTWHLSGDGEQTLTLRLRSTCVEFVRVEAHDNAAWQLSLSASGVDSSNVQTSLIPAVSRRMPTPQ